MKEWIDREIATIFFMAPNGWKLCSTKADEYTDKFKKIVLDNLGNHPLGEYEYIDDCACMLNNGASHFDGSCGCECHKEVRYYTEKIKELVKSQIDQAVARERERLIEKIKGLGNEKIVGCPLTKKEQKEFEKKQFFGIGQANMALRYEMKIDDLIKSIREEK